MYKSLNSVIDLIDYANAWQVPIEKNTVVINGFWRSGTTWLQEIVTKMLEAKAIFEPFQARAGYLHQCLPELGVKRKDYEYLAAFMPCVTENINQNTKLYVIIEQALKGQLTHPKVLLSKGNRQRLERCLSPRVVTKFTRAALLIKAMQNTFNVPVIHLIRDPRAVISSMIKLNPNWGEKAFYNFSLYDHCLEVEDDRKQYFLDWKNYIEEIEKTNDFGRLAGYFCLTERYLADSLVIPSNRFTTVRYENLVTLGYKHLVETLEVINFQASVDCSKYFNTPSSRDYRDPKNLISQKERIFNWKNQLSEYESAIIKEVTVALGMENYLWN